MHRGADLVVRRRRLRKALDRGADRAGHPSHAVVEDLGENVVLGWKVIVEARGPDAATRGDVAHRGSRVSLVAEQASGRIEHLLAHLGSQVAGLHRSDAELTLVRLAPR